MSAELDKIMAKLAAQGVTIETKLASGVPETDRPATRIRDAARRAGIAHEPDGSSTVPREPQPGDGPDYHAEHAAWRSRTSPISGSSDE